MSVPLGFIPRYEVAAPPVSPRPFGLLSTVAAGAGGLPVSPPDTGAFERGVGYWSTACDLTTGSLSGYCPDGEKEITPYGPVHVEAEPVIVTSGVVCNSPAFDAETEALAQLGRGEAYRVEVHFWERQTARPDLVDLGAQPGPECALGVLEAHAAHHYAGSPVLHVPVRYMPVLMAARLVVRDGDRLVTPWGTRVVVGAGYPGEPDDAEVQLLITGEVGVWRTEPVVTGDFDIRSNERTAIAERLYVMTGDCLAASVTVPACPGGVQ